MSSSPNLFFTVALVPVHAELDNQQIPSNYQAVVRTDTNQILGIHGPEYFLVKNEEAFSSFERALHKSVLDLNGMTVKDEISHLGARSIRTYTFPSHGITVARVGDVVNLQLKIVNSYDGSAAFSTILGGYRLVCTNGMVIGKTFSQSYARHTRGFNLPSILDRINHSIDVYCDNASQWQRWSRITVTDLQVDSVLKALPQTNHKLNERLLSLYQEERRQLGPTLWALFNAFTHYATHENVKSTAEANRSSIILQRENRVRAVLNSDSWRQLAAA